MWRSICRSRKISIAAPIPTRAGGGRRRIPDLHRHFVETGFFEGRLGAPPPVDESYYRGLYKDVAAAIARGDVDFGAEHYVRSGAAEGRVPSADLKQEIDGWMSVLRVATLSETGSDGGPAGMRDELRRVHRLLCARFVDEAAFQAALGAGRGDISTVARYLALPVFKRPVLSIYFDRDFYFASNPDVFERMDDPLLHFLTEGFAALRSPHPLIDLNHIVREDPATLGEPPDLGALLDLLEYDLAAPSPYFDPGWYAESLAHTGPPRGQLRHFLTSGLTEGRRPNRWLDPEWYAAQHDDVPKDRYGALRHFLLVGDAQGRAAGPAFDGKLYRRRYVDVADAGVPPLRHYLTNGRREGRQLPVERLAPLPGPAAPGAAVPVAAAMPIDPAQAAIDYAAMRRLLDEEQQVRKDAIVPTAPVLAATAADGDLAALAFPVVAAPKLSILSRPTTSSRTRSPACTPSPPPRRRCRSR